MIIKERFIDPFTDFGFKKLFGSEVNKDLLIDFLSELLSIRINMLSFAQNEHLGRSFDSRNAVFDLHCVNEKEEKFIIELQKAKQRYFKDRSLFYSTFPIHEQAQKGVWDYRLKAIFTISIMDFVFDNQHPNWFRHEVMLSDIRSKAVFYDKLTFIYLEMPKFNKKESELVTHFDKWMYLLKNLNKFSEIPSILQEQIFQKIFNIAEIANLNQEDMNAYEQSLKQKRDWKNAMDTAIEEAIEKGLEKGIEKGIERGIERGIEKGMETGLKKGMKMGREQGIEEGIKKGKLAVARQMKLENLPLDTISRITGLPIEEIEKLE